MTDKFWFEEELLADPESVEALVGSGAKSQDEAKKLRVIKRTVRLHLPRHEVLESEAVRKLPVSNARYHYVVVRLGCEFDPTEVRPASFQSAKLTAWIGTDGKAQPRVHSLAPVEMTAGRPGSIKLKLEPSLTLDKYGGSLGGIETDILVGQVAPVVRGFAGENEREPYWNLEHHREALLYGLRHFWLLLEAPPGTNQIHIGCLVQGWLQTALGRLLLIPAEKRRLERPRHTITLS